MVDRLALGTSAAQAGGLIEQEIGFVLLLTIAALVAILIRRIRLPYTVALVVAGLALSLVPNILTFDVSSDLILAVLVPPLVFEATLNIKWPDLRGDMPLVLLLAVGGTLLSTFIVGGIVFQLLDIPLLGALAFGALIAATDPVAVIAFFKSLGVSKRLSILVEGESLFNDGVAIVIFNLTIAAAAAALAGGHASEFSLVASLIEFLRVSVVGIGIGLALGFVVAYVILRNIDDHLIETATTVALAFGAYVAAESLHTSGLLAVVAAGLIVGNIGMSNTSPTTRLTLDNFWEFLAFVANSLVFLLIGLEMRLALLVQFALPIAVAVLAVLFSRAISVYLITALHNRLTPARLDVPTRYQHVMFWGGLRGAISLALALTVGRNLFGATIATEMQVMTFGVVLFTILVQGATIERLIGRLGLVQRQPQVIERQRRQALVYARQAGRRELDRLHNEGFLYADMWQSMSAVYDEEIDEARQAMRDHLEDYPQLEREMYVKARADLLKAERSAVSDAAARALISIEVVDELIGETDRRLAALDLLMTDSSASLALRDDRSRENGDE
jgi:CPA1 family monovalent cation:H+ antiporter